MENLPLGIKDVNIRKVSYGNGSTDAPTMTFLEDQQIGIYSTGTGVGFTVGGTTVVTVDSNNIGYNLTQTINNSATPPSVPSTSTFGYLFKKPGDGGLYWSSLGAGEIDLTAQTNGMPQVTFDAAFAAKTTDDLAEGSTNLYMTSSRFTTQFDTKTTTNLTEGTNLYYTDGRADTRITAGFASRTTSNLAEGSNLYFTNTRADARFDTKWALKTTDDLTQGTTNLFLTTTQSSNIASNTSNISNYLNQSVKTTASPTFAGLTISGNLSSYDIIPFSNTKTIGDALNYFGAGYITSIYGTLQTGSQPNITGLGTISSTLNIAANIVPTVTITNNLGSTTRYFASAYINLVNCNNLTLATSTGLLHSDSSGVITSSLIVNADISGSAAIADTKLATISTSGKVSNSATTATSANTASAIVARDASNNFSAGTITAAITGAASSNVLKAGDTMTGNLTMSGSNIVLDYRNNNILKLAANNGSEHIKYSIAADGPEICGTTGGCLVATSNSGTYPLLWTSTGVDVLAITTRGGIEPQTTLTGNVGSSSKYFNTIYGSSISCNSITIGTLTSAGIIHNNASGVFSSSLIVNADITTGTIANAKLATVSSANNNSYIVSRDSSGNFAASTITANLVGNVTGSASLNLLLTGGTLSGGLNMGTNAITGVSGITMTGIAAGILRIDSGGVISSSPFGTIDIADGSIANAKLATITSANTADHIVVRNASGNFSAGTITASLTGAASLNLLLTGGTLSGNLNMNADILPSTTNLFNLGSTLLYFNNSYINNVITNGITIAGFSTAGIIHNNSSGVFSSSLIVNADISASAAIADTKLATISTSGKVDNSATTATSANTASAIVARDASNNFSAGTITASLTGAASLNLLLTGGTLSGGLNMGTNVITGISGITAPIFSTAGIIHNDSSGVFSSSLIVNADVSASAAIADTKLATISTSGKVDNSATTATSANTASAIVARDASGNFTASTITASLTGAASLNLLLTGGTLSGNLNMNADILPSTTNLFNLGSTLLYFNNGYINNVITNGISIAGFSTAGIIHNNSSGVFSSSLIVNADVSASAAIADTKLATISTSGKVDNSATTATSANTASAIVARDASGNFSAGTITASLTGAASLNVLKAGDTMSGTLNMGTNAITGISGITAPIFSTAGIIHNNSSGVFSSSLIVNADVSASAAIADTKLATISTSGKVDNSATTATSANTALAIVARDASNNFSAGTITASLTGAASLNLLLTGGTLSGHLNMNADILPSTTNLFNLGSTLLYFNNSYINNVITNGITIAGFSTAGIIHNNSSGVFSSSLIVNADVSASAAIADTKLATISTSGKVSNSATTATDANTASAIVARDASGNFTAGAIAAGSLSVGALGTCLSASATDLTINNSVSNGDIKMRLGSTAGSSLFYITDSSSAIQYIFTDAGTLLVKTAITPTTNGGADLGGSSAKWNTAYINNLDCNTSALIRAFSTAGVVHNDSSGNLSTSLVVNADVSASAAIADTKLATISTSGKVSNSATTATSANTASAIVARDASNNFSAGTITASLTGAASLNVLKAGDTMSGTLNMGDNTITNASIIGTKYVDATCTGAADTAIFATASNGTYTGTIVKIESVMATSSGGFNFLQTWMQGGGSSNGADAARHRLKGTGESSCDGSWSGGGADYAEYFESTTGGALNIGKTVVIENDKVRYYNAETDTPEQIVGIVRSKALGNSCGFIGNAAEFHWYLMYLRNEYGDILTSNGAFVENPAYDPTIEYIPREQRPEWNLIGLLGQLTINNGETINPRWILMKTKTNTKKYLVR